MHSKIPERQYFKKSTSDSIHCSLVLCHLSGFLRHSSLGLEDKTNSQVGGNSFQINTATYQNVGSHRFSCDVACRAPRSCGLFLSICRVVKHFDSKKFLLSLANYIDCIAKKDVRCWGCIL